jgi:hypothetical protein
MSATSTKSRRAGNAQGTGGRRASAISEGSEEKDMAERGDEKGDLEASEGGQEEPTFPDGGTEAWLVVFGKSRK